MCEYLESALAVGAIGWAIAIAAIVMIGGQDRELRDVQRAWAAEVDERAWGHRDGNA